MCSPLYLFYAIKFLCYCSCRVEMWNFIISWDIRYQIFLCSRSKENGRTLMLTKIEIDGCRLSSNSFFLLCYEKSLMQLCWTVDGWCSVDEDFFLLFSDYNDDDMLFVWREHLQFTRHVTNLHEDFSFHQSRGRDEKEGNIYPLLCIRLLVELNFSFISSSARRQLLSDENMFLPRSLLQTRCFHSAHAHRRASQVFSQAKSTYACVLLDCISANDKNVEIRRHEIFHYVKR